jgi:DNA/RNA endonuclease G (NUC1)
MIYVVSGFKRSGTSMMMRVLKEIGIEPFYDKKREDFMVKEYIADNPYFYEVESKVFKGFRKGDVPDGMAIKVLIYRGKIRVPKEICKIIIMKRKKQSVLNSLKKYKKKKHFKFDVRDISRVDFEKLKQQYDGIVIDYDLIIKNPVGELARLKDFLGIDFDIAKISTVIDPSLKHN